MIGYIKDFNPKPKGGGIMKKGVRFFGLAVVFLITITVLSAGPTVAADKSVTLKMVQVFPKGQANMFIVPTFIKRVQEMSKGRLKIKLLGGPEAIPTFDQFDAVRSGVVDLNFNVTAYYYRKAVPEAMITWLSKAANPTVERQTGFYDLLNEIHQKEGLYYLGRGQWSSFYLWPNKKVATPEDMAGMKFRSGLIYDAFLKSLDAVPVTVTFPEIYTSLERKLVDGFSWPMEGVSQYGWLEVTKYCIDHPFYTGDFVFLVNHKRFNKLPKDLQQVLIDVVKELEPLMVKEYDKMVQAERKKIADAGVTFIKFAPKDAKKYVELAWQAGYDEAKKICRPQYFQKLMKMAGW